MTHLTIPTPHVPDPDRSQASSSGDGATIAAAWQKAQGSAAASTPTDAKAGPAAKKRKFAFDARDSSFAGRPDFSDGTRKKLKPNQFGPTDTHEDRRHQLGFEGQSKFLGKTHELAARQDGAAAADKLLGDTQTSHYPGRTAKGPKGLASVMNSHPGNLFLGNADENKAVEQLRSRSSHFLSGLSGKYAESPPAEGQVLQEARDHFKPDDETSDGITGRHNEMKQVAHDLLGGAKTDHEAIGIVHDLQFNGFFDMDHRTRPEHNAAALDLAQRMHSANLDPEGTSHDQRMKIMQDFSKLTYED